MGAGDWGKMLPEPDLLGKYFHEQFKVLPDHQRKRTDWKKGKNGRTTKNKEKRRAKVESCGDVATLSGPPEVELPSNASSFAVFASVRLAVLERWMKQACQIYLSSSSSSPPVDGSSEIDSDSEENTDKTREIPPLRVPKIVGVGLRSVFELIRESRSSHPLLCTKALAALLDVVQGQQPEGLKSEPTEVIDPLFDLLLDLATSHGPESAAANDGSHLTAVACACLLSLVVVRGDTGKLLSATAALLMCPRALASQNIHMPAVLTALQRSVHGVLLGKVVRPDWFTHGMPKNSRIDTFHVKMSGDMHTVSPSAKSLASDGQFLYLYTSKGLLKIGSGYGGTIKGHVYLHKADFHVDDKGWLGYANGLLYFKSSSKKGCELLIIDKESFKVFEVVNLEGKDWGACVMFSDGESLGMITSAKDDGFVVRMVNPTSSPVVSVSELPLKLARKCLDVFGTASFDEDANIHTIHTGCDEETVFIAAGKDFGLARTNSGKILYCGKSSTLGIKQGGLRSGKWAELPVTKSPKVVHFAIGHEGLHAVLLAEDGTVFFAGTARRGEDGDQNKARRQPKPVKPKKMIKVDGLNIVHAACNNGTTALVSKEGELLMFGKDTAHCDNSTGLVTDLKDVRVTQVSLGKAHAVALTNKGHVYTFGINNKGQCGRDFAAQIKEVPMVVAMETTGEEEADNEDLDWEDAQEAMCSPGKHKWRHDLCMVCTVCRECTGYSISCLSSMRPDRNPGQECGCGEGDSGCAECGCCRICARENVDNSELAILGPSGAGDLAGMMRLDLIFGGEAERRHGARLQDHLQRRLDERKQRQRGRLASGSSKHCGLKMKGVNNRAGPSTVAMVTTKPVPSVFRPPPPVIPAAQSIIVEEQAGSSDVERDASRVTSLPPARVHLPVESPVMQISCGLHHTVLLLQSGEVMTFGSNTYGQLGVGDLVPRGGPTLVKLACHAVHVAAGSNHTAVLSNKGEVYTFGSYQKGQLGRPSPAVGHESPVTSNKKEARLSRDGPWYAYPGPVPNIGPRHGRRATWVGASGDQTYLKIDESLINSLSLTRSTVMANKSSIVLLPTQNDHASSFKCLAINKRDGNCSSFSGSDQVDFSNTATCLDPLYNVLWSYHPGTHDMMCYNVVACESRATEFLPPSILSPELALPVVTSCFVTRSQAALHLLSCLDTLTQAQDQRFTIREESEDRQAGCGKVYSREDFSAVTRFESHGGGWGYSGHSIEAVRFMADTDILLGGFGLFGGRGEYTGKIKLFDIGVDGGEQETDGEMLAETEEVPYECGPRQKYPMLFEEPIPLQANRWYVAWARVSGPSSDCGSSGQGMVTTEDQVVFYFKSSKKSNNGTDVNAGQIPQMLYRVVTPENQTPNRQTDHSEPVYILSREFSRSVSRECFQSLLALLQWSWNTFKAGLNDISHISSSTSGHLAALLDLERLVYISQASLRLLRTYTNEIYPNNVGSKKIPTESVRLAECVGDVRALLRQILSDSIPSIHVTRKTSKNRSLKSATPYNKMTRSILEECHETFVSCFHAFYPTAFLKWTCLCDLLAVMDKGGNSVQGNSDRLLSAVLAALCSPTVRLRSTFPILNSVLDASDSSLKRQLSPSDNTGLPMMPCVDGHHYPILVEQMSYRSQLEGSGMVGNWLFREVLERLLDLVTVPVKQALCQEKTTRSNELVQNCCHLLARVVAELASQSSGTDEDLQGACGRVLHTTPSRFTRTNQSRTWNTGNGSPDAICFSVDRPGIVVAGVCVYGGVGTYEYELELLDDQNNTGNDPSHTQRWNSLEMARGTFGPDDCVADVAEVKFDRPVPIKENVKYAVRLRNHGGRTSNGDGGLSSVKGPDGATFSFSTCSLSFNGTTQTRGQIPQILYYSNPQDSESQQTSKAWAELQACKCTLSMTSAIVQRCNDLMALARERAEDQIATEVLGNACILTTLLPLILAHISPLATLDPRSGVQVLNLIQELLPHVAALNLLSSNMHQSTGSLDSVGGQDSQGYFQPSATNTTSHHYAWVESDHPYKPATVSNYRVSFPESVKWLCIEFDPQCGTAQAEDSLQLYVPSLPTSYSVAKRTTDDSEGDTSPVPYWPILQKFNRGSNSWPQTAIVLPGNEVIFSLETASDYVKDEKACFYGFRCLVVGYEWHTNPGEGLKHLETELAFLGGMCAASLMKKDLLLPPVSVEEMDEDMDVVEELAQHVYKSHSALLSKGFALANPPTITQALEGILPFSCHSNERLFLKDFVHCVPGTSGGRLSRWLQPDSYVDPARCEVLYSRDDMRCGWPAIVTVVTKDQYGDVVHVPNLKIEVKAVPIDKKEIGDSDQGRKMRRVSQPDALTFGGHAHPSLETPYEVTVKDKMCYYAITIMKAYENYSFEELRFTSPAVKRSSENMLVRPNSDGTYSATWTPGSVGWYSVLVTIDGYDMEEAYKVEVKEPPQGMTPPTQSVVKKAPHQPSRLRKFVAKNSAGLRIRAHPSLQSEQIGIVHVNGTIAFIDEIHNDDGVWLRLSQDTIHQYCSNGHGEAWCLQYNQHLGKTLLLPVEEPKSILDQVIKETIMRKLPEVSNKDSRAKSAVVCGPGEYQVVKCGASGHNVRSRPSLKAPPVGMLVLGNHVTVVDHVVNGEGTWVQLDKETMRKFCFNTEGEAWSLALSRSDVVYLRKEGVVDGECAMETQLQIEENSFSPHKRGFDFSNNTNATALVAADGAGFNFGSSMPGPKDTPLPGSAGSSNTNPFVFGAFGQESRLGAATKAIHDIHHAPDGKYDKPELSPKPSLLHSRERTRDRDRDRDKEKEKESSKFAALQKWLKGEEGRHCSERRGSPGRDLPPELVGVSVKDLVKAIGESRANGNGVTPPGTPRRMSRSSSPKAGPGGGSSPRLSRSSSPVPIPVSGAMVDSQHSAASHRRGSTQSDTSALVSSLTRDLSQSPSGCTTTANTRDLSPSPSSSSLHMHSEGSPNSTPGTPRKNEQEPLGYSPRAVTQTGTQTSPESVAASMKGHFSIGASGNKEERLSPKLGRKDRSGTGSKGRSSKRAMSPAPTQQPSSSRDRSLTLIKEPVKEAVSPSIAESLRAIFAAFLWHEGVVHDAMACASFLKFHPSLPKQGALVVTRQPAGGVGSGGAGDKRRPELTKEQRARQRHSVEVSTAGNYLHIQPSTLETLTRSAANANANRNRAKKQHAEAVIKEESGGSSSGGGGDGGSTATATGDIAGKLSSLPEAAFHTVAVLPPALKSLVYLWEELTTNCLQAIMQQAVLPSPTMPARPPRKQLSVDKMVGALGSKGLQDGKEQRGAIEREISSKKGCRKKKEWKPMGRANLLGEVAGGLVGAAAMLGAGMGGIERETVCELCGNMYPHPVTYHMRQAHPGCGSHAGGKGYNSGGNFCVGWAGNCGDGGVGGSSWYLVCDTCREKYLRSKKQSGVSGKDKTGVSKKSSLPKKKAAGPASSASRLLSPTASTAPLETHIIMRNNAMFLLDLASAGGSVFPPHQQRRISINNMPSVSENYSPPDPPGPFSPAGPFQCLQALGVPLQQMHEDQQFLEETFRRQTMQQSLMEAACNGNLHLGGPLGSRPMSEGPLSDNESEGSRGRTFHRSISMGTNGAPWSRREGDGRVIMMRKRNNSSGETASDGGSSLLCYPSAALQKLVPCMDQSAIVSEQFKGCMLDILNRPVMSFLLQQHNLEALQLAMRQALRKATCRVYALQALNWLLRSVTQPTCLHDLLWWFVAALMPAPPDPDIEGEEDNNKTDKKDEHDLRGVCEHPLSDISIAGEAVHPLPSTFHTLLQTIADLMLLLPMGSALQQMAIRCWGLRFTQSDHMFLHRSHVFSNISKILSRSEEEQDDVSMSMHESHQSTYSQVTCCVETLKDLTGSVEIKASSRQAMIGSLTDSSTETFWESGDEDRNKTKTITIMCAPQSFPRIVYIHIDNCRDLANKVSSVTFQSGPNADELYKLRQIEVENRSTGWVSCPVLDARHTVVRLELKGPDNSLRLRQIRVLGEVEGESLKLGHQHSAQTIQQRNCETETLRVFRLITSQVFGKLILGEQPPDTEVGEGKGEGEESNDLKEHMVGILFSRSKLTHLQKQVCMHIVQAIRKEATRVREEWESLLCSAQTAPSGGSSSSGHSVETPKSADTYCFEMLSMVLALSGSSVGRAYLSHQYGLLRDLLSLLHTGSARVQRQVTSLLRRMLPEISPAVLGNVMSVDRLPPTDFSIVSAANKALLEPEPQFDIHRVGILDVFLSCVAKALTVQVKVKGKDASGGKGLTTVTLATSIHPRDFVGSRWWLRGCITRRLAEVIIQLMKDMAAGKLSEAWANVTKGAVAENILNLTKLEDSHRTPSDCLHTPTLWLALASLCVLDSEHVERLSSGQWSGAADGQPPAPRPMCSNHDDGETGAIIQCNVCGNLCADCDRFLHLHRRTHMHQRQVCKEEEEAIKVDLHEGCGRTKLFWVMALADSSTLKAMVEFREGARSKPAGVTSGVCRFCGATGNSGLLAIGNICADQECQEHARNACNKLHPCGHMCGGIKGEAVCLPCLHGCSSNPTLKQDADDMCMICFTEALSCAPAIQLKCGHVFHYHCCRCVLMKRWAGPRITFAFSQCPICKCNIEHPVLSELLVPVKDLYEDVRRKALMRLEYEGLHKVEAITSPGARFHNDPASYAMDRYAYYVCYKCNKAYYGGEARCDAEVGEEYDPTELVCGACSDVSRAQMCPKHGTDFLEYKCRYCCSVAVFFCFGTTHFCNACHDDFQRVTNIPRLELPSCPAGPKAKQLEGEECPLHVKHPPTGEEFALGCGVCRNAHTF